MCALRIPSSRTSHETASSQLDRTCRNISQNPHVLRSNTAKSNNRCRGTPSALAQCQPKSDPTRNTSSRAHDSRRTQEGDRGCQAPTHRLCRVASDVRTQRSAVADGAVCSAARPQLGNHSQRRRNTEMPGLLGSACTTSTVSGSW